MVQTELEETGRDMTPVSKYVVQLQLLKHLEYLTSSAPLLFSSPTVHKTGFPPIRFHPEHYIQEEKKEEEKMKN